MADPLDPGGRDADVLAVEYDEALVFSLSGVVDATSLPAVTSQLREQMTPARPALIVNLTGVTFLDSSAIGVLFDLAARLGHRRQRYAIVAPSDRPIRSVLVLAGMHEVAALCESVTDALAEIELQE